jgi:hypothetical protein
MYTVAVLDPTSVLVEHGATSIDVALKHNSGMARINVPFQT